MRKTWKGLCLCLLAAAAVYTGSLVRDRESLSRDLIRLHVVGASDSGPDQSRKLRVRDAVLREMHQQLRGVQDAREARNRLAALLPDLQNAAEETLRDLGSGDPVEVSLCREPFPVRKYDTFTLPGGLYQSLRIVIGEGEGHNWWCVAFPELCMPAAASGVRTVAAEAGLSRPLRGAILGEKPYALRFYLLDLLGCLQNRAAS